MLSQFSKEGGHEALSGLDYQFPKDVYPVGRLDHDSEGLLILTNDNYFKTRLLDPKFKHYKTYLSQVEGLVDNTAVKQLQKGVLIKHKGKSHHTAPAKAETFNGQIPEERDPPVRFRKTVPTSWLTLAISEGKNRQVRKMTAAVGLPTLRLIRLAIVNLQLDNLKPREVRELTKEDIYHRCGIKLRMA